MNIMRQLELEHMKSEIPDFGVGDTVDVHYLIKEGDKERIQLFSGTVIAITGSGIRRVATVRRIVSGEGVERIFPLHSPRVQNISVNSRGDVRRAKLYYLRDRVGKAVRVDTTLAKTRGRRSGKGSGLKKADDKPAGKSAGKSDTAK
jgi:large subunit ribosomal protein L19